MRAWLTRFLIEHRDWASARWDEANEYLRDAFDRHDWDDAGHLVVICWQRRVSLDRANRWLRAWTANGTRSYPGARRA